MRELISYDNITLHPKHSSLGSRSLADTSVDLCGYSFKIPVVPSNMSDVISFENAKMLSENGYFYIMHRFNDANKSFCNYIKQNDLQLVSISLGVNDESKDELNHFISVVGYDRIDWICIDVAHGDSDKTGDMIKHIKETYNSRRKSPKIIAGNVATVDGYKYLVDCGADVVKCGIGQGSICSTRYKTGFHLPTAQSIIDCVETGWDVPIIADGGAKHFGDIAKALVLGASMVMSGRWFAECLDSPAEIIHGKKIYRGSTSYEAKKKNSHIEGQTLEILQGCKYADRLQEIKEALQSSISYAGGHDLNAFQTVKWSLLRQ